MTPRAIAGRLPVEPVAADRVKTRALITPASVYTAWSRHYHLKRRYGLGADDVDAMIGDAMIKE